MTLFRLFVFSLICVFAFGSAKSAEIAVMVGKKATTGDCTELAFTEKDSPGNCFYHTNVYGLTILEFQNVMPGKYVSPENDAEEIACRLLDSTKSCREAILALSDMFSSISVPDVYVTLMLADVKEAWIVEYAGKKDAPGAVWVALRLPDDAVSIYAGCPLIHGLPQKDFRNAIFSPDVISYARKSGLFAGKDENFDFAKAYCRIACSENTDVENLYGILGVTAESDAAWRTPSRYVSLYDIRKALRNSTIDNVKFSVIAEASADRYQLMQSLIYYAPGNPEISAFIPLFRNVKEMPAVFDINSSESLVYLLEDVENEVRVGQIREKDLKGLQIALEDSISVDVDVVLEQVPEFEDEEIAAEILQDLADIWAQKVKESYSALIRNLMRKEE